MYLSKEVELFYCNVVVLDLSSTTRYIQQKYFTDYLCPDFRNSNVTEIRSKAQCSIKKHRKKLSREVSGYILFFVFRSFFEGEELRIPKIAFEIY